MQSTLVSAAQMLAQGCYNYTNLQDKDDTAVMKHGLQVHNRLQTSSYIDCIYGAMALFTTEKASSTLSIACARML